MKHVMPTTSRQIPIAMPEPRARVRRAFPHLAATDLARIIDALLRAFRPERIYVFGSQARGTPSRHSDVDLFVVVPDASEFPHHLAQEAYRVVGHHVLLPGMVFMSREEFEWRADVVTSLPAAVVREGKLLYAATTA